MTALPVYAWEFPSDRASKAAWEVANRRAKARKGVNLLISRVAGTGPYEGRWFVVATGPDADPHVVGGGRRIDVDEIGLAESASIPRSSRSWAIVAPKSL